MDTLDLLNITVKEVMTTDLIVLQPDTILREADVIFERELIHHIPVVNVTGHFEGMISKSDILLLKDWGTRFNLPESKRKNTLLLTTNLAKDLMVTNVVKVSPDDTCRKCMQIFKENYFHALPVVDENGLLVGLVTTYDLLIVAYTERPLL